MANISAYEIDSDRIAAASFSGGGKKLKVNAFYGPVEFDPEAGEARVDQLADAIKRTSSAPGMGKGSSWALMEAHMTMIRQFAVPFTRGDQVRKTIKFQAESHYHSLSIDDMIIEYNPVGVGKTNTRIWCAAVEKKVLSEILEGFQKHDLNPAAMDLNISCLFNTAVEYRKNLSGEETEETEDDKHIFLVLDMGERHCRIITGSGQQMLDGRSFRGRTPENIGAPLQSGELGKIAGKIVGEIKKTFVAHSRGEAVKKIYYTGPMADSELVGALTAELDGVKFEKIDLSEIVDVWGLEEEAKKIFLERGAALTGLALKATGTDALGFDLRKEEFRYQKKFELVKRGLACTMVLLFVAFFVMAYNFQAKARYMDQLLESVNKDWQETILNKVVPDRKQSQYILVNGKTVVPTNLDRLTRELEMRRGSGIQSGLPQLTSAVDYLREFSKMALQAKVPFTWEKAQFNQKTCNITIKVADKSDGSTLHEYLRKNSKLLEPATPTYTLNESAAEHERYTVTMQLKPKGGPGA